jgi:hypothetical protein
VALDEKNTARQRNINNCSIKTKDRSRHVAQLYLYKCPVPDAVPARPENEGQDPKLVLLLSQPIDTPYQLEPTKAAHCLDTYRRAMFTRSALEDEWSYLPLAHTDLISEDHPSCHFGLLYSTVGFAFSASSAQHEIHITQSPSSDRSNGILSKSIC